MSTPHNSAAKGEIAKTVLMPGDPLRAQFIAETFLTDAKLVNNVRGIHGYTGTYQGVPVSVMASGMGMPSMGIYSHELFAFYDVENIIRIGSAGAMTAKLKLRDVVAAQGACTNSNYLAQFGMPGVFAPIADFTLLETAVAIAREKGVRMPVATSSPPTSSMTPPASPWTGPGWASSAPRWRPPLSMPTPRSWASGP